VGDGQLKFRRGENTDFQENVLGPHEEEADKSGYLKLPAGVDCVSEYNGYSESRSKKNVNYRQNVAQHFSVAGNPVIEKCYLNSEPLFQKGNDSLFIHCCQVC
jgi:hypothetical protein